MAEPDVPNNEHELADEEKLPLEPSPARAAVLKWLGIWEHADEEQLTTGRSGHLEDWDTALEIANIFADNISRPLLTLTVGQLRDFAGFLERLEWLAERLEGLFVDGCPPETAGALLNALEWINDGLGRGKRPCDVDVRDVFPPLDPALERRLSEMQAVINYWASFAAGRSKQIADLQQELAELWEQMADIKAAQPVSRAGMLERYAGSELWADAQQALAEVEQALGGPLGL